MAQSRLPLKDTKTALSATMSSKTTSPTPIPLPKFEGPLTAQVVTNWLKRCDKNFRRLEISTTSLLDDERKIEAAGDAIVQCEFTKEIYEWWVSNNIELMDETWEEFQDEFKNQALGYGWQLRLLREYYTFSQGEMTAKEYSEKLARLSKMIGCIDGEKLKVEPFTEKCQLLFRARPEVLEAVLENHVETHEAIINAKREDILCWLQRYGGGWEGERAKVKAKDSGTATFLLDYSPAQYIVGTSDCDLAGLPPSLVSVSKRFSNLEYLLDFATPKVTKVIFYNYINPCSLLGITLTYATHGDKTCPDNRIATNAAYTKKELVIAPDEYITSYEFEYAGITPSTAAGKGGGYKNFWITTSKNREVGVLDTRPPAADLKVVAPTGWAIVGFHGVVQDSGTYGWPVRGIGAIFARIPVAT